MLIGNRYELHEQIGAGGMGTVFRGLDTQSGETVAIKRLKDTTVAQNPAALERFQREAEALRQLNHPNIVKVLATADEDDQHFIIMEYIGGGSLRDAIAANSPLPISRIVSIALDLADALTRAHRLNIIHRDLKPANVLLADDGTPRLTDFGIAHIGSMESVTDSNSVIGTVDYLSPEALIGGGIDPRSDIWSFGVMLFEMIAGKRPFGGETVAHVLTGILTQPIPDLEALRPDAPVALVDLVYRTLDKDREGRIASVRTVGLELEAILAGKSIVGVQPAAFAPTAPDEPRFATPTPSASGKLKHNLPAQTTPFVGREAELSELAGLLDDPALRLITILAPGGMGKTRLALEMGGNSIERSVGAKHASPSQNNSFQNGVYFVSLAPLSSPENIVATIAEAVSFQFYPGGDPKQQLLDFFREKHLLLIMDNFEHLLDGVSLVSDILQAAPDVKIIATSRQRLNLSGETIFNLSGIDFPDWETPEDALQYSAVKLFMQSARRSRPDFELNAGDLQYVARICRLVEGMPLGILLAAAWIEALSLSEIADEIGKSFNFLETEMTDIPTRQRSIRAVFDYSWNLLTENERILFSRLSVFRGGFTREAAQAVAGAGLRDLSALVNKSLLRRDPRTGRYEVHELLRQYAEERLESAGNRAETLRQHSVYFAGFLHNREDDLKGRRQLGAVDEIETELDNIRLAWYQAVAHEDTTLIAQFLFSLDRYAAHRSQQLMILQLFADAAKALRPHHADNPAYGRLLGYQGATDQWLSRSESCESILREALEIARKNSDDEGIAYSSMELALAYASRNEYAEAQTLMDESIRICHTSNDAYILARALQYQGLLLDFQGKPNEAYKSNYAALEIRRRLGDELGIAVSLTNLSSTIWQSDEARSFLQEALAINRHLNNPAGTAFSLINLAQDVLKEGDTITAWQFIEESAQIANELGYKEIALGELIVRIQIAFADDDFLGMEQLLGQYRLLPLVLAQDSLDLMFRGLARVGLGDWTTAETHLRNYWKVLPEERWSDMPETLLGMSFIIAEQGQVEKAAEYLALALNHPNIFNGITYMPLVKRQIHAIKVKLGDETYAAAWERGKTLDLKTVVEELLKEEL